METAASWFDIEEVVADKAYSSRDNVELMATLGAESFIPFRSNAKIDAARATRDGLPTAAWTKAFYLYNYKRDEFLSHYHARSNAESTFSAVKRVLGDTLRSKTLGAQVNELLLKVIAHNVVCFIHTSLELGVPLSDFLPDQSAANGRDTRDSASSFDMRGDT